MAGRRHDECVRTTIDARVAGKDLVYSMRPDGGPSRLVRAAHDGSSPQTLMSSDDRIVIAGMAADGSQLVVSADGFYWLLTGASPARHLWRSEGHEVGAGGPVFVTARPDGSDTHTIDLRTGATMSPFPESATAPWTRTFVAADGKTVYRISECEPAAAGARHRLERWSSDAGPAALPCEPALGNPRLLPIPGSDKMLFFGIGYPTDRARLLTP